MFIILLFILKIRYFEKFFWCPWHWICWQWNIFMQWCGYAVLKRRRIFAITWSLICLFSKIDSLKDSHRCCRKNFWISFFQRNGTRRILGLSYWNSWSFFYCPMRLCFVAFFVAVSRVSLTAHNRQLEKRKTRRQFTGLSSHRDNCDHPMSM